MAAILSRPQSVYMAAQPPAKPIRSQVWKLSLTDMDFYMDISQ